MPLADFPGLRVTYPPELNPQRDAALRVPPEKSEKASTRTGETGQETLSGFS